MNPRSTGPTLATRNGVLARDHHVCQRCGRRLDAVDYSLQHRRPRGRGGSSLPYINQATNLVAMCGSATTGCHGFITAHETIARLFGWAVSLNATAYYPESVPVLGRDENGRAVWFVLEGFDRIPIQEQNAMSLMVSLGIREET